MKWITTATAGALALAVACGGSVGSDDGTATEGTALEASTDSIALVTKVFETPRDTLDNIDSPAVWHGPDGQHWLVATAKETDVMVISDATTGEELRRIGGEGVGAGRLDRPNGVAVVDDLMFVVERDNHRVQVFTLPDFRSLGSYGADDLVKPYGIAIVPDSDGVYRSWITDAYEFEEDVIPADSLLGERVREYRVRVTADSLGAELANTFGATSGGGRLRVVESIAADPPNDRLLIAEEEEGASMIKVYTLAGDFTGEIIDDGYFPHQAEGIVLYACSDGDGYWIATDQGKNVNTFHLFDRRTLEHEASFRAETVLNTDGIALTQTGFGEFEAGAFYAVHNDGNVAAFRWADIAAPLGLRTDCAMSEGETDAGPAGE